MYIPKSFQIKDIGKIHDFMESYSFVTLISYNTQTPKITHLPVLLNKSKGAYGTLRGHMTLANNHLEEFTGLTKALCIFNGPHAYISHTWYKTSLAVPTWNYAVVHAYGCPKIISQEELFEDLDKMMEYFEGSNGSEKQISKDYKSNLLNHIKGFSMEIEQIEAKFKLGQNRSVEDQMGMMEGLEKNNSIEAKAFLEFIRSQSELEQNFSIDK